jgi:cobalt-zinc-cadmium efflux system membrane fusion protein
LAARPRQPIHPAIVELPWAITFSSIDAVAKAGIEVLPVWRDGVTESLIVSGELQFDPARVVRLPGRVAGSAWRVFQRTGGLVRAGDVLALIESAEIGKAKAELQQALVQVRLKTRASKNIQDAPVAERRKREAIAELREAESRLLSAEQALVNFGFAVRSSELLELKPDEVSSTLQVLGVPPNVASQPDGLVPGSLLPIRAPFDGIVLEANVITGEVVQADQILFIIADPRELWLSLAVPASDIGLSRLGQTIQFRAAGSSRSVSGSIAWIGSTADEHTRTIPVRATLSNADGALRAYSLGEGRIVLRDEPNAIVVPIDAVQTYGGAALVFVRDKDFLKPHGRKAFYPRAVRLGAREVDVVEVLAGLYPGEVVATSGSRILLNEIAKGHITGVARDGGTTRANLHNSVTER